jgi:hypothetical protein
MLLLRMNELNLCSVLLFLHLSYRALFENKGNRRTIRISELQKLHREGADSDHFDPTDVSRY